MNGTPGGFLGDIASNTGGLGETVGSFGMNFDMPAGVNNLESGGFNFADTYNPVSTLEGGAVSPINTNLSAGGFNGLDQLIGQATAGGEATLGSVGAGGAIGAGGALLYTQLQNRPRGVFPITGNSFGKVGNLITDNLGNLVQSAGDVQGKAMTGVPGLLSGAKDYLAQAGNSPARAGLVGAGVGAGLGLLGGMRRPAKERSLLSDAAMGAAAGGAAGVGIPAVMRMFAAAGNTGRFADGLSPEVIRQGIEQDVAKNVSTPFGETTIGSGLSAMFHRPLTTAAAGLGIGGVANSLRHASHASANSLRHASHAYRDLFSKLPDNYWLSRVTPDELVNNMARYADTLHPSEERAKLLKEIASMAKQNPDMAKRLYVAAQKPSLMGRLTNTIAISLGVSEKEMPGIFDRVKSTVTPTTLNEAARAGRTRFSPMFGKSLAATRNPLGAMRLGRAGLIGGGALLAADALLPTMTDRSTTSLFTGIKP
jgi:hypothetical protein